MPHDTPPTSTVPRAGWVRWMVCALLFLATTINYIDRQVISVLKETLRGDFHWSEDDYGTIIFWFQAAYAVGCLCTGHLIDRIGVRWGLAIAVFVWSLAAGLHGFMSSIAGFASARVLLGLAEGGNFPAAVKSVGEWFPQRERALAVGLFNAGSNVGALLTPLLVPWITLQYGWRMAFFATAATGVVWLLLWLPLYRRASEHPLVSPAELAYIRSDPEERTTPVSWWMLLGYRQTWAIAGAMFCVGPVWWFYLFWLPGFLQKTHGLNLTGLAAPLVVVYLMTDVGSIGGGWISSHLLARGWSVNAARKTAMLLCACCVIPVFLAPLLSSLPLVVFVVGLAASAHQGFMANVFTLATDLMPRHVTSSVVGIGSTIAAIGGMLTAKTIGLLLDRTGSYQWVFLWASAMYLVALVWVHLLLPRLEPATMPRSMSSDDLIQ